MKLTEESAKLVKKHGLRESSTSGLKTGVVKGSKGKVKGFVEFVKTPGTTLTNPALLAGAAGVMSQLAMQQTMNEITDYLATIDEKVDDVLRAQKDEVLARMIGVGFVLDEAMTIREHGGRVNEVTWSKVQATAATIAETQAYALRQLDALAEKLESKSKIGDLAEASKRAESTVGEWLAVLARCFQLTDAIAILELDRVFDAAPSELDAHRRGLRAARQDRLDTISRSTDGVMARLDAAASRANAKVLMHPNASPAVVQSRDHVSVAVAGFEGRLGIESGRQPMDATRWREAALDVRDRALETGAERAGAARDLGSVAFNRARSTTSNVAGRFAERAKRRWNHDGDDEDPDD